MFKILSIVLGYHLPVVSICYGHKMRMNSIFGSAFKPAHNGVYKYCWFPGCIKKIHGEKVFLGIMFSILSIVLGIFFTF